MTTESQRPPYRWAFLAGLAVLAIYLATLAPTTAFWDTSEYIAAAKVLGIPHPPGNPLFVILAHTFGLLPLASSYAVRINLFAAVTSAAAAGFWFLVTERWLRGLVPVRWARYAAAFGGVLVGATSWTVWNQSTVNEKVYTVSLLSISFVLWLVVRWGDDEPGEHRDRWLILIAYVLALTSTNHLMGVLAAPALLVYALWTDWRIITRPWAIATALALGLGVSTAWTRIGFDSVGGILLGLLCVAVAAWALWKTPRDPLVYLGVLAVVVGVSINYVWLPMRAAQYPPINEGEPVGFFSKDLLDVLNREQYGKPPLSERQADFIGQLDNFWQYVNWQYARDWESFAPVATALFVVLGVVGLWALWRHDRRAGLAGVALLATLSVGLVYYMNFKYGFSQYPDRPTLPREVRERDYFFVGSFAAFGAFVSLGLGAVMRGIVGFLRDRGTERSRWAMASPVLALALIPVFGNRVTASRAHETIARDFAVDMLESIEPYGILITAGDNDTFPLWYAQEVEGIRPDVTLANLSLMNTRWHLRQLRRRVTPPFDPSRAASIWRTAAEEPGIELTDSAAAGNRVGPWVRPDTPVFSLTEEELDSLPEIMRVPAEGGLRLDSLEIRFGSDMLLLQDLATIFLIRDNLGKRPIYFSWSDGGYPDQTLGLTPYLVTHGFVRKLMPAPVTPDSTTVITPGLAYLDLPRTRSLLWNVYHWEAAARDRPRGWVDVPSSSILQLYSVIYGGTAPALREAGLDEEADRAESIAQDVAEEVAAGRQ